MDQNDPSTRHVLEGRELIDYLVEKASGATNAELLNREERRNRRTAALLSVLTFVGIGAIVGAIKMFVQQEIGLSETRVREQVTQTLTQEFERRQSENQRAVDTSIAVRVDEQVGAVRSELQHYKQYQELLAHAEVVAADGEAGKIAEQSLRVAIDAMLELAPVATISGQPRFLEAADEVISILVRTDRKADIDRLEEALSGVLGRHKSIAIDLADHYGELIIASPYPVEELTHEKEALARYARAAREHEYPEKALMWELFVEYKANGSQPNDTTSSLVAMSRDLNERDLNELCYQLVLHSDPLHWMRTPDHEGREIAKLVLGLLRDHPALWTTLTTQASQETLAPRIMALTERRIELAGEPSTLTRALAQTRSESPTESVVHQPEPAATEEPTPVVETASEQPNRLRR